MFFSLYKNQFDSNLSDVGLLKAKNPDLILLDSQLSKGASASSGAFAISQGLPAVSTIAEKLGIDRDITLVENTKVRYHADQITSKIGVESVRNSKQRGLSVTAGTSIHHLILNEYDTANYRTFFKLCPPLRSEVEIMDSLPAYPNGCHAVEVEVDRDTGVVNILRYGGVDDVGRVINPMLVDGQTQGGIAQGVGQALCEECVYDERTGQLLAGSFMDYCMPRASDVPFFNLENNVVPATNTFLGVKGGGEGGTTAAPPALVNAIVDALSEFGVTHIEMPATPEKIWRLINEGQR